MSNGKTIVCLANSRKTSGRCIAGKEVKGNYFGPWVRPVSKSPTGEISEYDRRFENGEQPQLLDIVSIPVIQHKPDHYQQENYLIDSEFYWEKEGRISWDELSKLKDTVTGTLWNNGYSSYSGLNDRIPEEIANDLDSSLLMIQPDSLSINVEIEGVDFGNAKRKVRAVFSFNNQHYKLAVTDPKIERTYLQMENGSYDIDTSKVFICVSIGEPYKGFCYKLVASVIYKINES